MYLCIGNGDIKLRIKCTTVLSEYKRYLATDCTDVLPHYMESLICMNIWNVTKFIWSLECGNIKGTLVCVVQKMELDACRGSSPTLKDAHRI